MSAKKFSVSVEKEAILRLASHYEFLARVSKVAVKRLALSYEKALDFLKEAPESCPIYVTEKPIDVKLRYKLFGGRYRIVFTIDEQMVYVYDIQDCRQDIEKNVV